MRLPVNKLITICGFLFSIHLQAQNYTYDDLGRIKSVTTSSSKTTYNYDNANNRTSVSVNRSPTCSSPTTTVTGAIASVTINAATILGICSDPGDTLTVTSPTLPLTYNLPAGQSRITNFKVSDGKGGTGSGSVTYVNSTPNSAPSCTSPSLQVTGNPASVSVLAADIVALCTDVNGNSITVTSPSTPYSFTLNAGAQKPVPYTVSDGNGGSATGTITYTNTTVLNIAPTCNPGSKSASGNPASVSIIATDITSLCSDANGDSLTVTSPTVPYNFTLAAGQSQVVTFTVSDGHGGSASNNLTVTNSASSNVAPTCSSGSKSVSGNPASVSITAADITSRCTDANGDSLTVTSPTVPYNFTLAAGQSQVVAFTVSDGHGGSASNNLTVTNTTANSAPTCSASTKSVSGNPASVSISAADITSSCSDINGDSLTVTSPTLPFNFTLTAGQSQVVAFTISDGHGGSASNNLTVTNTTANSAPTCSAGTKSVTGNPASVAISATDITARCSDINGDALTVTSPTVPYNFTLGAGQSQVVAFTVSDGHGGSASSNLTVTNTTANSAPTCSAGTKSVTGNPASVSISAADITSSCSDINGDLLTVTAPTLPYNFTLAAGQSQVVAFTVSDGHGGNASNNLTVTNTTAPVNHPPVCNPGSKSVTGYPASVSVTSTDILIGNCTDADGDTLTVTSPSLPYNFTLAAGASQTIPFAVADGHGGSSSNNLTVTNTTPVNNAPICTSSTSVLDGVPSYATVDISITAAGIIGMCSDANGDTLTVTSPVVPYNFTINQGQTVVTNFTVSDGKGGIGTGSITIIR